MAVFFAYNISAQTDKGSLLDLTLKLQLNECLSAGQNKLILKPDGNLVFMMGSTQVWESNTANQGVKELVLKTCKAVLIKANDAGDVWSSVGLTRCAVNAYLEVQPSGFGIMRGPYINVNGGNSAYPGDSRAIYGSVTPPDPNLNATTTSPGEP
ncbi:MAG: hypothetical protein IPN49_16650 [Saprospiraceae bacterium]|nr:hypothetical protein [Saprospiraceae bacterium]